MTVTGKTTGASELICQWFDGSELKMAPFRAETLETADTQVSL
jgi:uncharacterized protein YodC (DUF2158 family)